MKGAAYAIYMATTMLATPVHTSPAGLPLRQNACKDVSKVWETQGCAASGRQCSREESGNSRMPLPPRSESPRAPCSQLHTLEQKG